MLEQETDRLRSGPTFDYFRKRLPRSPGMQPPPGPSPRERQRRLEAVLRSKLERLQRLEADALRRREEALQGREAETPPQPAEPAFERPQPHVIEIAALCAEASGLSLREIRGERRERRLVRPRQTAMYLAKTLTSRSLPAIGRCFGGRDHSTVLHAVRKIEELLALADEHVLAIIAYVRRARPEWWSS